jgi:hypothetical protein
MAQNAVDPVYVLEKRDFRMTQRIKTQVVSAKRK